MDVTVVAHDTLDRWALVHALDLPPARGLDPESAFARLSHPTAAVEHVVVLVRNGVDLTWLRRVRRNLHGARRPVVVGIVTDGPDGVHALRAGADAVVTWDGDVDLVAAVERAVRDAGALVVVLHEIEPTTA